MSAPIIEWKENVCFKEYCWSTYISIPESRDTFFCFLIMKSLWFIGSCKKECRDWASAFTQNYCTISQPGYCYGYNPLIPLRVLFSNYLVNVPLMSLSISLPPQLVPSHAYGGGCLGKSLATFWEKEGEEIPGIWGWWLEARVWTRWAKVPAGHHPFEESNRYLAW